MIKTINDNSKRRPYSFNTAEIREVEVTESGDKTTFTIISNALSVPSRGIPHHFRFSCAKGYGKEIRAFITSDNGDNYLSFDENDVPVFTTQP